MKRLVLKRTLVVSILVICLMTSTSILLTSTSASGLDSIEEIVVMAYNYDITRDGFFDGIRISFFLEHSDGGFAKATGNVEIRIFGPEHTNSGPFDNLLYQTDFFLNNQSIDSVDVLYSAFYQEGSWYDSRLYFKCEAYFEGFTDSNWILARPGESSVLSSQPPCAPEESSPIPMLLLVAVVAVSVMGMLKAGRKSKSGYARNPFILLSLILGAAAYIAAERAFDDWAGYGLCWIRGITFFVTGLLVAIDARGINAGYSAKEGLLSPISWKPGSWAVLVMVFGVFIVISGPGIDYFGLVFWAVIMSLYILMRKSIYEANTTTHEANQITSRPRYNLGKSFGETHSVPGGSCPACGSSLKGPKKYCPKCDKAHNP